VNIRAQRLHSQHLAKPRLSPAKVVAAFGAMQAQEYTHAKWAVGIRCAGATDAVIERAIADGEILRTHPMRMTHHFVAPADIRWLLALLGPRMKQRAAPRWKELGLDDKTIGKSQTVIARALEGGKQLTRPELLPIFKSAGVPTEGQRMPHLLGRAEIDGLICSGARKGKQITFALLEDRVPKQKPLTREASLAELAKRYFTTRGPATLQDFMWWSGITAADAKAAVALADPHVVAESIGGTTYWLGAKAIAARMPAQAYVLPMYDEYAVAYRDRSAIGSAPAKPKSFGEATLLTSIVVIGGEVVGTWSRVLGKQVAIKLSPWRRLAPREQSTVAAACERYAQFVGLPLA
jgi:hypothetical protein